MCRTGQLASAADAASAVTAGLSWLAAADMTELTTAEQADCLRALERAESQTVAARSAVLAAFDAGRGFEDDAAGGCRSWLRRQTRVTTAAAAGAVGWMRRLAAHPAVAASLADGGISASWARHVTDWSDRLPIGTRADADEILLAAAAAGAELNDLGGLAEEMFRRRAPADSDGQDDGFRDRSVRLAAHFRGADGWTAISLPSAPRRCVRSWTPSAPGQGPRTTGPSSSEITTRCSRPVGGSSHQAACRTALDRPQRFSCT